MLVEVAKHGNTSRALRELGESNHWFYALVDADASAAEKYARAKRYGIMGMADEVIDISDDSTNDKVVDEDGNERTNTEVVARSRLRVDSRKWLLSKIMPKVYGEKQEIDLTGNVTLVLSKQDLSVL